MAVIKNHLFLICCSIDSFIKILSADSTLDCHKTVCFTLRIQFSYQLISIWWRYTQFFYYIFCCNKSFVRHKLLSPLRLFYYSVHFWTVMLCFIITVHFCTVNTFFQKTFHFCTVSVILYINLEIHLGNCVVNQNRRMNYIRSEVNICQMKQMWT